MIMGIISLIFFIVGLFLSLYKFRNNSDLRDTLGIIIMLVGEIGAITFIIINRTTILSWFTF